MKFLKSKLIAIAYTVFFSFDIAFAYGQSFKDFIYNTIIGKILTPVTGIVISLIILYFFFNSATYLFKANKSAEERKKIMESLMWSVIVLFILLSVWGIVRMIAGTLSIELSI